MKNVLSIVLNTVTHYSRVQKEGVSLQRGGYRVIIVGLCKDTVSEFDDIMGVRVHRLYLKSLFWRNFKGIQLFKFIEFTVKVISLYKNKVDIIHCNDLHTLPSRSSFKKMFKK